MKFDHAFSPLPQFYPWDTPLFWDTLYQQYLCEISTDKNLSGDRLDVSEESSLETYLKMQPPKEFGTPLPMGPSSSGLHPSGTRSNLDLDSLARRTYDRFPETMKRLAESEQNENPASERPTHGVRSN